MSGPMLFIVTSCWDEAVHIKQCVQSVLDQTYTNWVQCVVVDEAESMAGKATIAAAKQAAGADSRVLIVPHIGRGYRLKNNVMPVHQYCPHDAVVCYLDGDDYLADADALAAIAVEYEKDPELDFLWTRFRWDDGHPGFCADMPVGANPFDYAWVTSHMQTFKKYLLWGIPPELLMHEGFWYKAGTDQALILPIMSVSKKYKFLPRVTYVYRNVGRNVVSVQASLVSHSRKANRTRYPFQKKNVLFVVNGPEHQSDKRLAMGERRAPLGVISMAAHLIARGHDVLLIDRFWNPVWFPTNKTLLEWADVVGVYVSSPNMADGRWIVEQVRSKGFKGMIVAGGPHTVLYPREVRGWGVDVTCDAEADFIISHIVEKGYMPKSYATRLDDLDILPFPAYSLVRKQRIGYANRWPFGPQRAVSTLNTSRGCPHACAFCETRAIWGRKWVGQSPERIALDIEYMHREFGVRAVYFREDNFGASKERLLRFCELAAEKKLVDWACELRADVGCEEDVIEAMHVAGCKGLYVGAESGSDNVLRLMNKGVTVAQVRAMCEHTRKRGIRVALSIIDGFPGETSVDKELTQQFIRKHGVSGMVWRNQYREPTALKHRGIE